MSYGVGRRPGSDSELLWLWCRLAAGCSSAALIRPLAWELTYATGAVLKRQKKKKKKKTKKKKKNEKGQNKIAGRNQSFLSENSR